MNIGNIYTKLAVQRTNIVPFKQKNQASNIISQPVQDTFVKSNRNTTNRIAFGAKVLVDDQDIQEIIDILGLKSQPGATAPGIADIKRALRVESAVTKKTMEFLHIDGRDLRTGEQKRIAIDSAVRIEPKTRLGNIDSLLEDIKFVRNEFLAKGKPVTFAMFDLDNFKSVNDLLSYDVGDDLIKLAAQNIASGASKHGFKAYRFGGEEFIVIMPGIEQKESLPMAQGILDAVNGASFTEEHIQCYVESGQRIIDQLTKKQEPFKTVIGDIKQLKMLVEIANDPCYKRFVDSNPKIKQNIEQSTVRLKDEARFLLLKGVELASSSSEAELLMSSIEKLDKGGKLDDMFAEHTPLSSLLYSMFYKQDKINEIKKWITAVQLPDDNGKPKGFTMSGGVMQFDDAKVDANEYIRDIGKVLAYAKRHQKGRLYQKTPSHYSLCKTEEIDVK